MPHGEPSPTTPSATGPSPAGPAPGPSRAAPALVLPFAAVGADALPIVGGKGANLAWMARAGLPVPPGFCVTTAAFHAFLDTCPDLDAHYAALEALAPDDVEGVRIVAGALRAALGGLPVPPTVADAILATWRAEPEGAWAVRSSATAEDLPDASFAGQQDTYLNVRGEGPLLVAVRDCWVSLFTDRAVLYRARNHFPHRAVALAVVVQRMVAPDVAGILFTADPITGSRAVVSIDAGFGLGEALVSGLVNADLYKADKATGALRSVTVGDKPFAIRGLPEGGTVHEPLPDTLRAARCLDDAQVAALVAIGRRIEAAAGGEPQDVEWCLEGGRLHIVQARPITSLYPLATPPPADGAVHVYFSFGHAQMMPEAMPPLARDVWVHILPFGRGSISGRPADRAPASRAFREAGSRLYIDVTTPLRIAPLRAFMLGTLNTVYPHIAEALTSQLPRLGPDRRPSLAGAGELLGLLGRIPPRIVWHLAALDPATFATRAEARLGAEVARVRSIVEAAAPGEARVRAVRDQLAVLFHAIPGFAPTLASGVFASKLLGALGFSPATLEPLLRALPENVTTDMDLALADLAELARGVPGLAERLERGGLVGIEAHPGAEPFRAGLGRFVATYGVRGAREIDVSQPRWADDPGLLVQVLVGNLRATGPSARERHAAMAREAEAAGAAIVASARFGTRGIVRRLVAVMRHGLGVREHGKWFLVRVFAIARAAALEAGALLVARGALRSVDDVWLLDWDELVDVLAGRGPDAATIAARRERLVRDQRRAPPLVMASDGEIPTFGHRAGLPEGALAGLAASAGVVEGVARVVRDPGTELLHPGEILVAPYTDPGWTPLFTHAAGLVTDVGGLMTHGSVVAREMGLPAVVGVTGATSRIRTGDRLRVDGSRGYVEILGVPTVEAGAAAAPPSARPSVPA